MRPLGTSPKSSGFVKQHSTQAPLEKSKTYSFGLEETGAETLGIFETLGIAVSLKSTGDTSSHLFCFFVYSSGDAERW